VPTPKASATHAPATSATANSARRRTSSRRSRPSRRQCGLSLRAPAPHRTPARREGGTVSICAARWVIRRPLGKTSDPWTRPAAAVRGQLERTLVTLFARLQFGVRDARSTLTSRVDDRRSISQPAATASGRGGVQQCSGPPNAPDKNCTRACGLGTLVQIRIAFRRDRHRLRALEEFAQTHPIMTMATG